MGKELQLDDFMKMLHELDNKLTINITIKAIGGFSIILNSKVLGLNLNRKSRDIDSLTKTWDAEYKDLDYRDIEKIVNLNKDVDDIIWDIGVKYGANEYEGWLNNSWYDSKLFEDELEDLVNWIDYTEEKFNHIILKYADLESIFLFKIRSINDIVSGKSQIHDRPRNNDVYDVINILDIFNEEDILNIKNKKMSIALDRYQPALHWLKENIRI